MKNIAMLILLAIVGISATVEDQTRIGYVYMDLVLQRMDETVAMNRILQQFSAEKTAALNSETEVLNGKIEELNRKVGAGELTAAGKIIAESEVADLKRRLEEKVKANEQELYAKRTELLTPIARKLEAAMDHVAAENGYKYVLNSSDGTGNSIMIVAPESDDLTQEVMEHLGIRQ